MSAVDRNNLQNEERDWIGKARTKKAPTTRNWKLRMSEKELEEWKKKTKQIQSFFQWGIKKQLRESRSRRSDK